MRSKSNDCADCGAAPGGTHLRGCDWALCPDCGTQRISCTRHDPERPSLWHGEDPRDRVARELNWWTTFEGHRMEDTNRVQVAAYVGQITWNPQTQWYDIGQIDAAEIDRTIAAAFNYN